MNIETSTPLPEELLKSFQGDDKYIVYPINKREMLKTPTGTGINLDPSLHESLVVGPGCWFINRKGFASKP